jgi:hypothetical protein
MKNSFLIVLLLFTFSQASAQNPKYEFSISPILNFNPNSAFKAKTTFGLAVAGNIIVLDKQKINLSTGLSYEYNTYQFDQAIDRTSVPEDHFFCRHEISTHILMIPITMRLKMRKNFYTQIGLSTAYNYLLKGNVSEMATHDNPSLNREEVISTQKVDTKLSPSFMTIFNVGLGKSFVVNEKMSLFTQLTYSQDFFSSLKVDYHDSKYSPFDFSKKYLALTIGVRI